MPDRYASLKQGLVGCWIPSISGSGLLLPDLSGRGNNGSLIGMDASDWVSASYGRALDFDGSNDYSTATLSAGISGSFTFSCWAFIRTLDASVRPFITSQVASYNNYWASLGTFQSRLSFGLFDGSNNPLTGDTGVGFIPNTNQWYHFVGVRDVRADTISDYVNGVFNRSVTDTTTSVPTYGALTIGGQTAPAGRYVNGLIDDVRVYDRVLSPSEIHLLASEPGIGFKPAKKLSRFSQRFTYNPPKARNYSVIRNRDPNYSTLRQGLVAAYCPSISGQGNVLPDLVGGNHGTLTNMDASDWVSSGDGRALDFDGNNDVVSISGSVVYAQNGQPFTASIHAYVRNFTNPYTKLLMLRSDCVGGNAWEFGVSDQGSYLGILIGTNGSYARIKTDTLAATITSGWHHYLVVYNGGDRSQSTSFRIYFDGTLQVNSGAGSFSGTANTSSISLDAANNRLNGVADDIRIYNRALTESEIKLLASKRGIGLEPRKPKITFADLGVQKTYSVIRVKEIDYGTLRQGLVGAWCPSLPNGGSGNTLPDVSGYGNHGVLTNMGPEDWVSGQYGRALDFDGVNDRVAVGTFSAFATDSQTITAWINPASVANPDKSIVSQVDATGNIGRAFRQSNQQLRWTIASAAPSYRVWATGNTLATGWQHVTVSYTGINTPTMYRNAVQQSVTLVASNGSPTTPSEQVLSIGYDGGFIQNLYNFFGGIDDVRIYNRILTEPEIRLLASRPGIGLRQESHRNTFYQFPSGARRKRILTGMP